MSETADEAGTAGAAPVVAADAFTVPSVLARRAPTHAASLTTAVAAAPEIVRSPVVLGLAMRKVERWTATALSDFEEDMLALVEMDDDAEAIVQLREALGHVSSKVKMNLADVRVRRPSRPFARSSHPVRPQAKFAEALKRREPFDLAAVTELFVPRRRPDGCFSFAYLA